MIGHGWQSCKFCEKRLNGRLKLSVHQKENHQAEIKPGTMFQRVATARKHLEHVIRWSSEHDEAVLFLSDQASLAYPSIRRMVERKDADSKTKEEHLAAISREREHLKRAESEWLGWVMNENPFEYAELLRLVKLWNSSSFRPNDERRLKLIKGDAG